MKEDTLNVRTSVEDKEDLKQAAENLSVLDGGKPSVSKAVRAGIKLIAETDPNAPILFYVNRNALREFEVHLADGKARLQNIYDEYLNAVGTPSTMEQIESWFGTTSRNFMVANTELIRESIVMKKYLEQRALYPGLQFGPEQAVIPDLDKLNEAAGVLIFIPTIEAKEYMFWQCYAILNDKVELVPDAVEKVKNDRWRVYAVTPDEKARLTVMRKLCDLMNTIKIVNPAQLNMSGLILWDEEAGIFVPGQYYIKGYVI